MRDTPIAREFEQVEVADQIRLRIDVGPLDRIAYPRLRTEMDDPIEVTARERGTQRGGIGEVEMMEGETVAVRLRDVREPRPLQRGVVLVIERIDADDAIAAREQRLRGRHADEAGGSGNQRRRHRPSPSASPFARTRPRGLYDLLRRRQPSTLASA